MARRVYVGGDGDYVVSLQSGDVTGDGREDAALVASRPNWYPFVGFTPVEDLLP